MLLFGYSMFNETPLKLTQQHENIESFPKKSNDSFEMKNKVSKYINKRIGTKWTTDICGYKSDFKGFYEANSIDKFNWKM